MKKKLFISHASEDKDAFVSPLAETLRNDFDVWFDEYQLVVGMSLLEEISKGLATCDYGVVVLSKSFFAKKWTLSELNGLFSLEEKDKKVILPVWYDVVESEVKKYSPILADRVAVKAEDGIAAVVKEINRSVTFFERGKSVQAPKSGVIKLRSSLQRKAEEDRSKSIINSSRGVDIAGNLGKATVELLVSHVYKLVEEGFDGIQTRGQSCNGAYGIGVARCSVQVWIEYLCLTAEYHNRVVNSACDARLSMTLRESEIGAWGEIKKHTDIEQEKYFLFIAENDDLFWRAESGKETLTSEELVNKWLARLSDQLENK